MKHLTEEQIIEYLESGSPEDSVREHLETCDQCQLELKRTKELMDTIANSPEYNVPEHIAENLSDAIKQELSSEKKLIPWVQIAAAIALLVVGFTLGKWSAPDYASEVLALQSQVSLLKEMQMVSALSRPTASQRIQAVNQINRDSGSEGNEMIINTLMNTLNTDDSPNVRHQAAQALGRFTDQQMVRLSLAKSLERQSDPLIQIALISILTEAQEKNAVKPLQEIIEREYTSPEVKRQAEIALKVLI